MKKDFYVFGLIIFLGLSSAVFATGTPPTILTKNAISITSSSTVLVGAGNPNGATTTVWFRLATTSPIVCNDTFGIRAPAVGGVNIGNGTSTVAFQIPVNNLVSSTTYFYCALGSNMGGIATGSVKSFMTK